LPSRIVPSGGTRTSIPRSAIACICAVPVARVTEQHLRAFGHGLPVEVAQCRLEHRLEMPEVRRVERDLGREDDLPVVDRELITTVSP